MKSSGSVIVSWDFSNGKDVGVLIVGEQKNGKVNIINAFQGQEAKDLYKKLTTPKLPLSNKQQKSSFVKGDII